MERDREMRASKTGAGGDGPPSCTGRWRVGPALCGKHTLQVRSAAPFLHAYTVSFYFFSLPSRPHARQQPTSRDSLLPHRRDGLLAVGSRPHTPRTSPDAPPRNSVTRRRQRSSAIHRALPAGRRVRFAERGANEKPSPGSETSEWPFTTPFRRRNTCSCGRSDRRSSSGHVVRLLSLGIREVSNP